MWYNAGMDKKTIILVALAIIAIMNIAAFALMGHDKRCARQGKWRVPEKTLFLVTACFGGLGGVLGMKVFHHKTQHWYMNPGSIGLYLVLQTHPFMHALYAVPVRQAGTLPAGFISFPRHPASFGFRLATDTLAFG